MKKFHLNPDNGAISRCHAEHEQCPFLGKNGMNNHFDSIKEARAGYEKMMSDRTTEKVSKENELRVFVQSNTPEAQRYVQLNAEYQAAHAEWQKLDNIMRNKSKNQKHYRGSDEWFQDVQQRKQKYFTQLKLQHQRRSALPQSVLNRELAEEQAAEAKIIANRDAWFAEQNAKSPYEYHPEITESNEWRPTKTIMAFTGKSQDEVRNEVNKHMADGLSRTEAYRAVWRDSSLRTDKPIVALDLEVASPNINNKVDLGSYSTIIEFGYIKRYPDGTIEKKSFLTGLPDDVRDTIGTGAEDVHNITPKMLEGVKPFQEDGERIREFVKDVDGTVIIAHNANYEKSQLSHSIYRFAQHEKSGRVEMLDTREVSQWFMPDNQDNSNNAFTTNNGVAYEGAHRAFADAEMTMNALFNSKGIPTESVEV